VNESEFLLNKTAVAYYRVSTRHQKQSGLGLEAQRHAVEAFAKSRGIEILAEHVEVESGKKASRPRLNDAIRDAKATKSVLLIAKLDRLARNAHFLLGLMESGLEFTAVDTPSLNRFTATILAAVAEDEARRISERTKAALRAAKRRGKKLGGWRGGPRDVEAVNAIRRQRARERAAALREPVMAALMQCTSYTAAAELLNTMRVPTPRGDGRWHFETVRRIARMFNMEPKK
jgi:DNA invertase Pin-like site-specific DNA recombinase